MKRFFLGCILALAFGIPALIVCGVALWTSDPFAWRRPADHELIRIFQKHRDVFEEVRAMVTADASLSEGFDTLRMSNLDHDRRARYATMLTQIGRKVRLGSSPPKVDFEFANGGLGPLGDDWRNGISYIPNGGKCGVIVKSLDHVALNAESETYCVPLQGNWYLFLEQY
jgi:hypothetical protein